MPMQKKLYLTILIAIFFNTYTQAQTQTEFIENGEFENWFSFFGVDLLNGWVSTNHLQIIDQSAPITVTKIENPNQYNGDYSAEIETKNYPNNPIEFLPENLGFLITATVNASTEEINFGYPYHGQPEGFSFWAKYEPNGVDTAFASASLLVWDEDQEMSVPIATANIIITQATSEYQQFSTEFVYSNPNVQPDSALVIFSSSEAFDPKIGSKLTVDDAEFYGGTVSVEDVYGNTKPLSLFPNPANEFIRFEFNTETQPEMIEIYAINGQLVSTIHTTNNAFVELNTAEYNNGVYIYKATSKQKIIQQGKFVVSH